MNTHITSNLRELSAAEMRAILDIPPFLFWAKDVDGRFVLCNQPVAKTVGELIQRSDGDLVGQKRLKRRF